MVICSGKDRSGSPVGIVTYCSGADWVRVASVIVNSFCTALAGNRSRTAPLLQALKSAPEDDVVMSSESPFL